MIHRSRRFKIQNTDQLWPQTIASQWLDTHVQIRETLQSLGSYMTITRPNWSLLAIICTQVALLRVKDRLKSGALDKLHSFTTALVKKANHPWLTKTKQRSMTPLIYNKESKSNHQLTVLTTQSISSLSWRSIMLHSKLYRIHLVKSLTRRKATLVFFRKTLPKTGKNFR